MHAEPTHSGAAIDPPEGVTWASARRPWMAAAGSSRLAPRPSTAETVLHALRWQIGVGRWTPGQSLPSERDLAEAFGVGRSTLQAALDHLRAAGLIVTTRGRHGGTRVAEHGAATHLTSTELAAARASIEANFEFRRAVEPAAATLAANRATARQLAELAELLETVVDGVRAYRAVDSSFHISIAAASGNTMFEQSVAQARYELFTWADSLWLNGGDWDSLAPEYRDFALTHRVIYDALSARDDVAAAKAVTDHLHHGERSYLDRLDRIAPTRIDHSRPEPSFGEHDRTGRMSGLR